MIPAVRVICTDSEEIQASTAGSSMPRQRRAWTSGSTASARRNRQNLGLRHGDPAVPAELLYAVAVAGFGEIDRWTA
jgi:hypothetical protein